MIWTKYVNTLYKKMYKNYNTFSQSQKKYNSGYFTKKIMYFIYLIISYLKKSIIAQIQIKCI